MTYRTPDAVIPFTPVRLLSIWYLSPASDELSVVLTCCVPVITTHSAVQSLNTIPERGASKAIVAADAVAAPAPHVAATKAMQAVHDRILMSSPFAADRSDDAIPRGDWHKTGRTPTRLAGVRKVNPEIHVSPAGRGGGQRPGGGPRPDRPVIWGWECQGGGGAAGRLDVRWVRWAWGLACRGGAAARGSATLGSASYSSPAWWGRQDLGSSQRRPSAIGRRSPLGAGGWLTRESADVRMV